MKPFYYAVMIFIGAATGSAFAQSQTISVAGSLKVTQSNVCFTLTDCSAESGKTETQASA